MPDLALNNSLIEEYLNYKFEGTSNQTKIRKLFKYIKSFSIRTTHSNFFSDPATARQFIDPVASIIDSCSDEDLVQSTVLKLMLVDTLTSTNYRALNIMGINEKLKLNYGATYPNSTNKDNAQEHIKALLSDAAYVIITDGYIATSRKWDDNKNLIADIVPNINIKLTLVGADKDTKVKVISQSKKDELKEALPNLRDIKATQLNQNIHDRYIETDKLKILLSSGLEHLSSSSNKDFTYIVEIKNEQ